MKIKFRLLVDNSDAHTIRIRCMQAQTQR